ncbi:MAG: putative enzyme related to lactoylglutathione lyase [Patiriisocius sp.]|jgi:predicted enzyme related to lactoylglutathione lyase
MIHQQIQYVEFLSKDLDVIKKFYTQSFGWVFTDWGPEYIAFDGEHVSGGFSPGEPSQGSILVIVYSKTLEATQQSIEKAGGVIIKEIFSFPGGRRFRFTDPDGNELAVWSDV